MKFIANERQEKNCEIEKIKTDLQNQEERLLTKEVSLNERESRIQREEILESVGRVTDEDISAILKQQQTIEDLNGRIRDVINKAKGIEQKYEKSKTELEAKDEAIKITVGEVQKYKKLSATQTSTVTMLRS